MRHRLLRRQWKRRCQHGHHIPALAIVEFRLDRWFDFEMASERWRTYRAKREVAA